MAGGYRPGSGAKKNNHRIAAGELREALERALGMPFAEMLAQSQLKLYSDFQKDINVKEFCSFTEKMCNRVVITQANDITVTDVTETMTLEEKRKKVNQMLGISDVENDKDEPNDE